MKNIVIITLVVVVLLLVLNFITASSSYEGEIALADNVYTVEELQKENRDIHHHIMKNKDDHDAVQLFVTFRSKLTPEDWSLVPGGEYIPKHTVVVLTNSTYARDVLVNHPRVAQVSILPHKHKYSKCIFNLDLDSQEILSDMSGLDTFTSSQSISEDSKRVESLDFLIFPTADTERLINKWSGQAKQLFGNVLQDFSMTQVSPKKISAEFKFKDVEHRLGHRHDLIDWIAQKNHIRHVQLSESFHTQSMTVMEFLKDYASYPLSSQYQSLLEDNYKKLGVFSLSDVQLMWKWNITGKDKVVGVGDTGMDLNNCMFRDETNPKIKYSEYDEDEPEELLGKKTPLADSNGKYKHRKVAEYWAYGDKADTPNGHGSHVAGVLAGSLSSGKDSLYTGVLPDVRLAFVDLGMPDKTLKLPQDLSESYFPFMQKNGAKVFSNSWGNRHYGVYTLSAREIDLFMWKNQDTLAVYAAGNSGREGGATITAPGTSKNCLTVGASEADEENFKFGIPLYSDTMRGSVPCSKDGFIFQMPEFCGPDRPIPCNDDATVKKTCDALKSGDKEAEEICCRVPFLQKICCSSFLLKKNLFALNKNSKEYQSRNVAVFSSRGPTVDGRIKPEILTIGQPIFSVRAHGKVYDGKKCPVPQVMQGTSQATPVISGLAVMLRTYMETLYAKFNNVKNSDQVQTKQLEAYSNDKTYGSMIKALIINSGSELTGVVDINGQGVIKKLNGFPSFTQGFGVVNLTSILPFPDNSKFLFAHQDEIQTNKVQEYCFVTKGSNSNIKKATLVWSDYPANPSAKFTLVNNLDLIVYTSKKQLWGNNVQEGDEINVVEQVTRIPTGESRVKVVVKGTNVPHGPQPFSLVVSGTGSVEIVAC
jgi:subtilisin family serine protease